MNARMKLSKYPLVPGPGDAPLEARIDAYLANIDFRKAKGERVPSQMIDTRDRNEIAVWLLDSDATYARTNKALKKAIAVVASLPEEFWDEADEDEV